jgi:putative DNA methylase
MVDRSPIRTYRVAECVSFRSTKEKFGGLSNMAGGFPLRVNGILIPSAEAIYQACRFPRRPDVQKLIIEQRSPMTAKMVSKPYRGETRPDWNQIRVRVMRWTLRVKLAMHWPEFGGLLLATGDRPIVEDSRRDDFWGAMRQDNGTLVGMNVLGRLLMELREELKGPDKESLRVVSPPPISDFVLLGQPIGQVGFGGKSAGAVDPDAAAKPGTLWGSHVDGPEAELDDEPAVPAAEFIATIEDQPARREGNDSAMQYPKRLIEVDLPIKRISAHARREKSIRHGHISTLHIWWARRPLAACRAVICAALWPDPADPLCPQAFRLAAEHEMRAFAKAAVSDKQIAGMCDGGSWKRYGELAKRIEPMDLQTLPVATSAVPATAGAKAEAKKLTDLERLRGLLLDFIADFANWDASTVPTFLKTARALTQAAHEALGGAPGTRPLVVDPFAGGGAIPLEALRVGADAFASDLNPVAVLLNKVVLEYIPKYGQKLADEVRKWGQWVKEQAEKELGAFYPKDQDGAIPIAYIWARTVRCEGPGCGATIPLLKSLDLVSVGTRQTYLQLHADKINRKVGFSISAHPSGEPTTKGWTVTCPICQFGNRKARVQFQLSAASGGADKSVLVAVVTHSPRAVGKQFRIAAPTDVKAVEQAIDAASRLSLAADLIPTPAKGGHRAVSSQLPLYGFRTYSDFFTARQRVALSSFSRMVSRIKTPDDQLTTAVVRLLSFCVAKQADYLSSLCRWRSDGAYVNPTLGGEKKYVMISDFVEACPLSDGPANWNSQVDWVARVVEREGAAIVTPGTAVRGAAQQSSLPEDSADAIITDPPYYDSVPYSDLSNFYLGWLRDACPESLRSELGQGGAPKDAEATVNHPGVATEIARYENLLCKAFESARLVAKPNGFSVIVFAHKSTSGWEALLAAIVNAGWQVVASWPVDTEMQTRLNAKGTASLASSVHICCRPRENSDGSLRLSDVGDWRDVLTELPKRIHEWLPRLAEEGVVGADAIFACLGPALEIFSRYSRVEKASGEQVLLREYLEQVWAAVSKEALGMIFAGGDATGFEEDARLTAMWLWTLASPNGQETAGDDEDAQDDGNEDGGTGGKKAAGGYSLEYDAARKIAQGLGAHLEKLAGMVEVKGDTARLLSVAERTKALFGKDQADAPSRKRKKKDSQMRLGFEAELEAAEAESGGWGRGFGEGGFGESSFGGEGKGGLRIGETVLDRLHQSMILFAAGRGEALRRFLVDEGIGSDHRLWRLAQALSALYPANTDEKRWVDGVLARKKGLGF